MTSHSNFTSEGFDLDAIPDSAVDGDAEVIYEVGGSATAVESAEEKRNEAAEEAGPSPLSRSEELKAQGNEEFKNQNYLEAYDMYTAAIEACPGMKGEEILRMRDEFDEKEREKLYERNRSLAETRRRRQKEAAENGEKLEDSSQNDKEDPYKPEEFKAPPHEYGENLSIYYCNRAACKLHLNSYDDAIQDCDLAILLRPTWAKAYVRRSLAYENTERTEDALRDARKALELDPKNAAVRKTVARLQKLEDERLEKLKEETIGKLKDLGNSILGNFGLSLDNFKTVQDPNTGSYSISFEQGGNK
jgi:tetratricopeptide (TPR) repeat protein